MKKTVEMIEKGNGIIEEERDHLFSKRRTTDIATEKIDLKLSDEGRESVSRFLVFSLRIYDVDSTVVGTDCLSKTEFM